MSGFLALFATVIGGWILFNLLGAFLVGLLARAVFPGKQNVGWPMTIVLGFVGGLVGKMIFFILKWPLGFPMGFFASVAGAFLLLFVYHVRVSKTSNAA